MAQDATLHVKVEPSMAKALKRLAKQRKRTMGELVRQAIAACYQVESLGLPLEQSRALAAYQGGFISLGKLAEAMGMHVLDLRDWLMSHGLAEPAEYDERDASNA